MIFLLHLLFDLTFILYDIFGPMPRDALTSIAVPAVTSFGSVSGYPAYYEEYKSFARFPPTSLRHATTIGT
jgi:hypothetical protein